MNVAGQVAELKALTSLRFVAAMMIVVHHAPSQFTWKWAALVPSVAVQGVSFFFVLSGFILTHVYSTKPMPSFGLFMRARFARLWPVHVAAIIFLVLSVSPDSITFNGPGIFDKWIVLVANLALVHSILPFLAYTFSWNAVSWSISTEMFFYLAFPLLIANVERTWHWKFVASAVLAAAVICFLAAFDVPIVSTSVEQATAGFATYPSPLVRGMEFCAGIAACVLWRRHVLVRRLSTLTWTIIESITVALVILWLGWGFPQIAPKLNSWVVLWFGPAGSFWAFAILIAVFATGRGTLSRALSIRPLVFLGEISFSIYMLHQILMKAFVTTLDWRDVPEIVYLSALFILASASYLIIEKPGQRLLLGRKASTAKAANVLP